MRFTDILNPYAYAMKLRRLLYRKNILPSIKVSVPVISIGNLSMGGTGKTPVTLYVAEYCIESLEKKTFFEIIALSNIFIVLPVILYYKSLFFFPIKNINQDPVFYVMTGILFGMSLIIPIDALHLLIKSYSKFLFLNLYTLNSLGYILMHIFFIKSYLTLK